jgi:hypothetical protein
MRAPAPTRVVPRSTTLCSSVASGPRVTPASMRALARMVTPLRRSPSAMRA